MYCSVFVCSIPRPSSFRTDQFTEEGEENEKARASSFSWFFFFQNVGNFCGESANPELREVVGPLEALVSITGSLGISLMFFVASKRFLTLKDADVGQAPTNTSTQDESRESLPYRERFRIWRQSDDARAIWKITVIFTILSGTSRCQNR